MVQVGYIISDTLSYPIRTYFINKKVFKSEL